MNPKVAPELYYIEKIGQSGYTSIPTGRLDVGAILKGSSRCWVSTSAGSSVQKRKTLVIDSFFADTTYAYQLNVKKILKLLLEEGFEIYTTSPIRNFEDLALQVYDDESVTDKDQYIIQKLAAKRIPRDRIFFLDYFWLQKQTHPTYAPFLDILNFESMDRIIQIATKSKLGSRQIFTSRFELKTLFSLHDVKTKLGLAPADISQPSESLIDDYKHSLMSASFVNIERHRPAEVPTIIEFLVDCILNKTERLHETVCFTIDRSIFNIYLNLIKKSQFKTLAIPFCKEWLELQHVHPKYIEQLTLFSHNASTPPSYSLTDTLPEFLKFLTLAQHLKKLTLLIDKLENPKYYLEQKVDLVFKFEPLKDVLEELTLSLNESCSIDLGRFLKKFPSLKKFKIIKLPAKDLPAIRDNITREFPDERSLIRIELSRYQAELERHESLSRFNPHVESEHFHTTYPKWMSSLLGSREVTSPAQVSHQPAIEELKTSGLEGHYNLEELTAREILKAAELDGGTLKAAELDARCDLVKEDGPWVQIHFIGGQPSDEAEATHEGLAARDITDDMFTGKIWEQELAKAEEIAERAGMAVTMAENQEETIRAEITAAEQAERTAMAANQEETIRAGITAAEQA
ncbi:MAG: hypothetical protein KBD64_02775, partial [Gammaproteobacteria bacterium]|nr:hypothetical protein [Gammaproteobacteria bacterium]